MDKNKELIPDTLSVKELNLASYLMSSNEVSLVGNMRDPDGTVYFLFKPAKKTEQLINSYWQDQGPAIPARQLFGAQRDLKDLIFSGGVDGSR